MANNFDEATQRELQTFLDGQQAQARVQQTIHSLTSMCWDKCVTSTPGTRFSRGEENCLHNCVGRFLDTSLFIVNKIQESRGDGSL